MQYRVVLAECLAELEQNVHVYIQRGFVPIGGVDSRHDYVNGGVWYHQAVYRSTPENEEQK